MPEIHILQDLALIFAASVISLYLCHLMKLPPIVGFLLAGIAVGPYGFGLIRSSHQVEILAEIGVILLLFTIGIEFSIKELLKSKRTILLGGALQVGLTAAVAFFLMRLFDLETNRSVFVGFLVALSSTAIVLRSLQDRGELYSAHGRIALSILIFQDVIIVPMMIFTPLLAGETGNLAVSLLTLTAKGLAMILLVFLLARYVVPQILYQVARTRSRELFLLSTALICIAIAWVTSELGLSLGLGAFLAGLMISESEYSFQSLEGILPFKIIFTSFFFISIGMLLDTSFFVADPLFLIAVAVLVLIIKAILAAGVALTLGMSARLAVMAGLILSQVGEFSFILSKKGIAYGLLPPDIYQIFLAVSIITMAVTPFIINVAPRLAQIMADWPVLRRFRRGFYYQLHESETASEMLNDHLIIIGFGINGHNIARAAREAEIPYTIIEMNPDTVRKMRREGEPIMYGDAAHPEILKHAAIKRARIAVIAISDPVATRRITQLIHDLNPGVYIIVRTRFVKEMAALYDLGADEVIPEEFETSVEIFTRVLLKYLVPRDEIDAFTDRLRSDSYAMLRRLTPPAARIKDLQLHIPEMEIHSVRLSENSPVIDQTLQQADLRRRFGVNVLAVMKKNQVVVNPDSATRLELDDILYILGTPQCCSNAGRLLNEKG